MAKEQSISAFMLGKIIRLDEDDSWSRAMLAKLRHGIGKTPGEAPAVWELTLTGIPDEWRRDGKPTKEELTIHTVLTLYALHRQGKDGSVNDFGTENEAGKHIPGCSFGTATARLVKEDDSNFEAVKRRFDAVATASAFKELANHARGIVQLLKAGEGLKMDYPRFASDLYYFQFPRRKDNVRLRWGEDFYQEITYTRKRKDENTNEK